MPIVELWGILEGLNLAWDLGLQQVEPETDSQAVKTLLYSHEGLQRNESSILMAIRKLLTIEWQ
ncbi:hypothetical protein Ancab_025226, partial [Ancistrocladus abbreviatus]